MDGEKAASKFAVIAEAYGWPVDTSCLDVLFAISLDMSVDPRTRVQAATTVADFTMPRSRSSRAVGTQDVFTGVKDAREAFIPPTVDRQDELLKQALDDDRVRLRDEALQRIPVFNGTNVVAINERG